MLDAKTLCAFLGDHLLTAGSIQSVLTEAKKQFDADPGCPLLIFEEDNGKQVDFDLRGPLNEVLARALPSPTRSGPGRPKLGVVAREISLLPRHWDWLEEQPNGASAAIRRLVDEVRKNASPEQRIRATRDALGRFLSAIAGNFPGYEEATRALYAGDRERFESLIAEWPPDIREYAGRRWREAASSTLD